MLQRECMNDLISWGNNKYKKPLLVKGMRQVGKTTTIKQYARDFFPNNHVYLNLFEEDDLSIFNGGLDEIYATIEAVKGITINDDTLIIIDEVQKSETAYIFIKLVHDSNKSNNLICSGSYVENAIIQKKYDIPMGCYDELILYPLTFYEYAINKNEGKLLQSAKNSILSNNQVNRVVHNRLLILLDEYLLIGGMPNIVNMFINTIGGDDVYDYITNELDKLQNDQREDIQRFLYKPDKAKVLNIYNSIETTMKRTDGAKIDKLRYKDIDIKKPSFEKYESALKVLTRSKVLIAIQQTTNNDIKVDSTNKNIKLVYSDMGYLSNSIGFYKILDIIKNKETEKGYITENFVAIELQHHNKDVSYWYKGRDDKSNSYEVDFKYYNKTTKSIIPIEVKSGIYINNISSLKKYIKLYFPSNSVVLSRKNISINHETNIINFPLYAIWILNEYLDIK